MSRYSNVFAITSFQLTSSIDRDFFPGPIAWLFITAIGFVQNYETIIPEIGSVTEHLFSLPFGACPTAMSDFISLSTLSKDYLLDWFRWYQWNVILCVQSLAPSQLCAGFENCHGHVLHMRAHHVLQQEQYILKVLPFQSWCCINYVDEKMSFQLLVLEWVHCAGT